MDKTHSQPHHLDSLTNETPLSPQEAGLTNSPDRDDLGNLANHTVTPISSESPPQQNQMPTGRDHIPSPFEEEFDFYEVTFGQRIGTPNEKERHAHLIEEVSAEPNLYQKRAASAPPQFESTPIPRKTDQPPSREEIYQQYQEMQQLPKNGVGESNLTLLALMKAEKNRKATQQQPNSADQELTIKRDSPNHFTPIVPIKGGIDNTPETITTGITDRETPLFPDSHQKPLSSFNLEKNQVLPNPEEKDILHEEFPFAIHDAWMEQQTDSRKIGLEGSDSEPNDSDNRSEVSSEEPPYRPFSTQIPIPSQNNIASPSLSSESNTNVPIPSFSSFDFNGNQ